MKYILFSLARLEAFSGQFDSMDLRQQQTVVVELILPFLSRQGPGTHRPTGGSFTNLWMYLTSL